MSKKQIILSRGAALLALAVTPFLALAQTYTPGQGPTSAGPQSVGAIITLLTTVVNWFTTIVFAVAIIMILVAAFQFLTAAGNEEKVTTARKSLIWGLVGIAVALFANVARSFVANLLGGA